MHTCLFVKKKNIYIYIYIYSTRKQTGSWTGHPDIRTAKMYISVLPEVSFLLSTL